MRAGQGRQIVDYLASLINAVQNQNFSLSKELALKLAGKLELLAERLRKYGKARKSEGLRKLSPLRANLSCLGTLRKNAK